MKKALKWIAIIVGIIFVLLIGAAIALPFILPLEKIKDIATAKISETIDREVKVESVSFNLFSGIELKGLSISNRPGFAKQPFVTANAIALRYAFWPIFKRQVVIKEIRLVKPEILIEKSASGVFNFSDMVGTRGQGTKGLKTSPQSPSPKKSQDFSMVVDTFSIRDARITYIDYGTNSQMGLKNADLTVSGITLAMLKPIGVKFSATADYKGKDVPLSLATSVRLNLADGIIELPNLKLGIAGEKADISAKISELKAGPAVNFSITSKKLGIDPLVAVFTAGATAPKPKEKLPPGELTKRINKIMASVPAKLKVKGNVDMGQLSFLNFKVNKAKLDFSLNSKVVTANINELKFYEGSLAGKAKVLLYKPGLVYSGNLKLADFNAAPFSNAVIETFLTKLSNYQDLVDKVYGTLDASVGIEGSGIEVKDILANANASGSFSLKDGELKRLKTLDAIADKIKVKGLKQDLKISELSAKFTLKDQIIDIQDLDLKDGDLQAAFKGGVDLARLKWVSGNRLTLKGSPRLTQDLPREYNLLRAENGWLEATFELSGDLKKPIPIPILEKPLEKAVEKVKIKIEAKKVEIEEAAKKKAEEEKARLAEEARKQAEEAKKKAEEEAKKQLKDLIKF